MAKNFVGEMDSMFHPFCSKDCPCMELEHKRETMYAYDEEILVSSYVTCQHYDFCKKLIPAIRDGRVYVKPFNVSKMDTTQ